jgi:hypothetical protein
MRLRYILPVLMTLAYVPLVTSAPAQYYIGYEKLRGTYIVVGTPPFSHRIAYGINAPATAIAMLGLRFRGRLTGEEERIAVGILVPVLWLLVGAFLDRALRNHARAVAAAIVTALLIAVVATALIETRRYVMFVWIAFAVWVLWERARWRREGASPPAAT